MGKRGPPLKISRKDRLRVLKRHQIFTPDGKVKTATDPIWITICEELNKNYQPKNHITTKNF